MLHSGSTLFLKACLSWVNTILFAYDDEDDDEDDDDDDDAVILHHFQQYLSHEEVTMKSSVQ